MKCIELREDLEAVLDSDVDETRMDSIELHLASCESCRSHLDRLQSLRRVLCENGAINVPPSLDERVFNSFNARLARRESPLRRFFLATFRIPAPIFALFLLTAVSAVPISYWLGKRSAAPVTPVQVVSPIDHGTSIGNQEDRPKPGHQEIAIATPKKKAMSQVKRNPLSAQVRGSARQLRSSTTINVNSTTYSTVASLPGFEPLITANARIIRGGHDK